MFHAKPLGAQRKSFDRSLLGPWIGM